MSKAANGCAKIRGLLEAYFEDVLPAQQEQLVAEHLWQCPRCAAELEQIRRLALALESLPAPEPAEDLLTAISARLDAVPAPGARGLAGWRRLGGVAGLAMAVWAALIYAAGPAAHLTNGGAASYVARAMTVLATWTGAGRHVLGTVMPALHGFFVAIADTGKAAAPMLGLYAAAELALVIAVTMLLRSRREHAVASTRVGARRL